MAGLIGNPTKKEQKFKIYFNTFAKGSEALSCTQGRDLAMGFTINNTEILPVDKYANILSGELDLQKKGRYRFVQKMP